MFRPFYKRIDLEILDTWLKHYVVIRIVYFIVDVDNSYYKIIMSRTIEAQPTSTTNINSEYFDCE